MFQAFTQALQSGDLNDIITTSLGQIILFVIAALLFLFIAAFSNKKGKLRAKEIAYTAIAITIATLLSNIKFSLPQGGSVTAFSMLFILIIGNWYGLRTGLLAGIVYGILQLILGGWVAHPIQLLMDYPLAFAALGLSGLFKNSQHGLIKGTILGILGRFIFHFLSGVIFFASYAGDTPVLLYSLVYNGFYLLVEGILTVIVLLSPPVANGLQQIKRSAMENVNS